MSNIRQQISRLHPAARPGSAGASPRPKRLTYLLVAGVLGSATLGGLVWYILSDPQPALQILLLRIVLVIGIGLAICSVLLIGIGAAICYALWRFWLFVRLGIRTRRQQAAQLPALHQSDQRPVADMMEHLKRGEIPHLADDGEIRFENNPQYTSQSRQD